MRSIAVLLASGLIIASCSPESGGVVSTNSCAGKLYPSYNPKALNQCIDVCTKCERGTTTTCSTSCTLKGAR
jgi:hypothetical protein